MFILQFSVSMLEWHSAVSRPTAVAEGALGRLVLRGIPPRLHSLLQVGQDVWHHGLFRYEHGRLHHQQQGPSQSSEPVRGSQSGEVLTELLPVLVGEKRPGDEEEEPWGGKRKERHNFRIIRCNLKVSLKPPRFSDERRLEGVAQPQSAGAEQRLPVEDMVMSSSVEG